MDKRKEVGSISFNRIIFQITKYILSFAEKSYSMRIIAHRSLIAFYTKHNGAKTALENWYTKVCQAEWSCFADIKRDFNSADFVGNQHYVFNIKGNDYRLVVVIKFQIKMVYIRFVGTHKEYDKIDCSKI